MKKILLSLLLMVVFAVPAFSQMRDDMSMSGQVGRCGCGHMMEKGHMGMMGCHMMCMNQNLLGLSDDQIQRIKPLHRDMEKRLIKSKADLKLAEIDLMEIMEVKDFDMDKAIAAVKRIENLRTAQHLEMLKAMKNMRAILTDEQFKNMRRMCMGPIDKERGMTNKPKSTMKKTSPR